MNFQTAIVGAMLVVLLSAINWRISVKAALVLVVLEGAIRKWLFPQASEMVYFLKDFVLLGAYIRYFLLSHAHTKQPGHAVLKFLLILMCMLVALNALNPLLNSY